MHPSQALKVLLAQHAALRELMDRCEVLADELDAGRIEPGTLVSEVAQLRVTLDTHNHFEEQVLRPILREADAFGAVRIEQMVSDHVGEHRLTRDRLETGVTGQLRATIAGLRAHIEVEERHFLSSKVLRDDVVVVESTG